MSEQTDSYANLVLVAERSPIPIEGRVAPGFESVLVEFRKNFTERGELGAALAVYRGDECLVDLWGGWVDPKRSSPWQRDTMVLVFSTTKGMAAVAMAVAASQGDFSYEGQIADYWPEFASNGKGSITIESFLAHQAGLPVVSEVLTPQLLSDHDRLAAVLANEEPRWAPGERHGYHALVMGFYESEIIRRTDREGRTIGQFFSDEVAGRLDVQFHIGLPEHVSADRVAPIRGFYPQQMMLHLNTLPAGMVLAYMLPWSLTYRAMSNPKVWNPAHFDRPEWRRVEFPSGGGIGEPRAIARVYADLASSSPVLGVTREVLAKLEQPFPAPRRGRRDAVLHVDTTYAGGFIKPPSFDFGTDERAYGTMGAGGSFGFADPATGVGFAYAGNRMGFHLWNDPREHALRDAVFRLIQRPA